MEALDSIKELRLKICELAYKNQEGHLLSSLSCLDAMFVLYSNFLEHNENMAPPFILSKGHAAIGLYVILKEFGFLTEEELDNFAQKNSNLGGHPDAVKVPQAIASTGSLGHGFPITVGLAMSDKKTTYWCLMGDGELMEGTFWETMLLVNMLKIDNLHLIVDFNDSHKMTITSEKLLEIFSIFDWDIDAISGHNHHDLKTRLFIDSTKPKITLLRTVRGYGIGHIQGKPEWHHRMPTADDMETIRRELGE